LLSPVGHRPLPPPASLREGLELVFEQFLIGSYQTTMPIFNGNEGAPLSPQPEISVVAPSQMLGFASLLNFSTRQVNRLINSGYHNARRQLG
jgi:hypothetical protein